MANGGPLPVREYTDYRQMQADAAAVRARMFAPRKPVVAEPVEAQEVVPLVRAEPVGGWSRPRMFERSEPHIRYVIRVVSVVSGHSIEHMAGDQRKGSVVKARQIACYLAMLSPKSTLPSVGRQLGKRDHTTVLHACRRVAMFIERLGLVVPPDTVSAAEMLWASDWKAGRHAPRR